jgi:hypothetical protein
MVIVMLQHDVKDFAAPDAGLIGAMMSDPKRQEDMMKAGVTSAPVVQMFNKV